MGRFTTLTEAASSVVADFAVRGAIVTVEDAVDGVVSEAARFVTMNGTTLTIVSVVPVTASGVITINGAALTGDFGLAISIDAGGARLVNSIVMAVGIRTVLLGRTLVAKTLGAFAVDALDTATVSARFAHNISEGAPDESEKRESE
ncbi:hypothetical protein PFISCL1PPCAC_4744 [Pristionchus fissidentatus]|uniref:Uncharacterized protein n=1 Tax=Pristionchus fissidentatus TaxID=1538716 RepID=A0AAV5V1K6_9BILA|nr:hypothetical protein PFISCL1PPCAC_4743 [Pristionchus fissidentatus]GMT13447.1 hypothetical protein PFISCL1PPCAC_4744 [Pristionchus fissidentatus]